MKGRDKASGWIERRRKRETCMMGEQRKDREREGKYEK